MAETTGKVNVVATAPLCKLWAVRSVGGNCSTYDIVDMEILWLLWWVRIAQSV
jgi:hypothetical protein